MTDSTHNEAGRKILRSGRSGDYSPLGEAGQPVFRVSGQLRDTLRRKLGTVEGSHLNYADHFAIPVSDQRGDVTDWYSSFSGDVIPWSSATEDERSQALAQLRVLESKINQYCSEFYAQQAEQNVAGESISVDTAVFARLLPKILFTPDAKHTYLVNGFPVLTFWGFIYPKAKVPSDPLLHFVSAPKVIAPTETTQIPAAALSAVTAKPVPPLIEPTARSVPEPILVKKRSLWRRWLWWLLPLLLLLWLLFGLRYCSPQMADRLGVPDLTDSNSSLSFPKWGDISIPGLSKGNSAALNGGTAVAGTSANLPNMPNLGDKDQAQHSVDPANLPPEMEQPAEQQNPAFEPPQLPQDEEAQAANPVSPAAPAQGKALEIPSKAPDGQAQFLNGKWKAGAGIQDKNTGKPLRLEYDFNKGQGQVTVQSADGMRCTGDVDAQMAGGRMRINSLGPARCPDGSSFDMPEINCAPGAKSAADCIGNYADARFPMSMRNTQ